MKRFGLLLLSGLAVGCGDVTGPSIRAVPNQAPIAHATFDTGVDAGVDQLLGYVVVGNTANLDGSGSHDPDDANLANLAFTWEFDEGGVPEGSELSNESLTVADDNVETGDVNEQSFMSFMPDVLGTYRIKLTVTDDKEDVSNPAFVFVQAVPPEDLEIRTDWESTQADLDLHLVAPGGSYFGDDDCFSWNPNPDWGDPALAGDNPELLGDNDGEGGAPYAERIRLAMPQDGDYELYVHYYSDHSEELGNAAVPSTPTFVASVFGEELAEPIIAPQPLLNGDVWCIGTLRWPEMELVYINTICDHFELGGPDYNDESVQ